MIRLASVCPALTEGARWMAYNFIPALYGYVAGNGQRLLSGARDRRRSDRPNKVRVQTPQH
jgi:hypothetical protein